MANQRKVTTTAKRLEPLLRRMAGGEITTILTAGEGPGIDVLSNVIGLGLDSILRLHANGDPATEYATIGAAFASPVSGDVVLIARAGTFSENVTVAAGMSLIGMDPEKCVVNGIVTLSSGASIAHLTVSYSASSAGSVTAVVGPSSGTARVVGCAITGTNTGAGAGYAIAPGGGTVKIYGGSLAGSTARIAPATIAPTVLVSAAGVKCLDLWNGSSNNAEPAGWKLAGFDDSAWAAAVAVGLPYQTPPTGATAIWSKQDPASATERNIFRQTFTIANAVLGASLSLSCDDNAVVYIDGTEVASKTFGAYTGITIDPALLTAGSHCIGILGINTQQPAADVSWRLVINYIGSGQVYVHAAEGSPATSEIPLPGDRSAWDTSAYPTLHADLIDDPDGIHWTQAELLEMIPDEITPAAQLQHLGHGLFVTAIHSNGSPYLGYTFWSADGINWQRFGNTPIHATNLRDPALLHYDGYWWLLCTRTGAQLTLLKSADLLTWTEETPVSLSAISPSAVWAPQWYVEDDGGVHVLAPAQVGGYFRIYEMHPANRTLTAWSTPVEISISGVPTNPIDPCLVKVSGVYYLFFKDNDTNYIDLATSTALTTGYTVTQTGNWAGWRTGLPDGIEGPALVRLDDGRWRMYYTNNAGLTANGIYYSETTDSTFATGWTTPVKLTSLDTYNHPVPVRVPGTMELERLLQQTAALQHSAVTVSDTATIDLTLSGQALSADLKNTTVTPGSYTTANITVDAQGRITAASNGTGASGEILVSGASPVDPLTNEDETDYLYEG